MRHFIPDMCSTAVKTAVSLISSVYLNARDPVAVTYSCRHKALGDDESESLPRLGISALFIKEKELPQSLLLEGVLKVFSG